MGHDVSLSLSLCPVTPQDYQPPGFKEADGDSMEFEREPVKLTMGEVATPFHTLRLDMATERHRLEQVRPQCTAASQKHKQCRFSTTPVTCFLRRWGEHRAGTVLTTAPQV